ncbi:MAG: AI-2E family transporter [Spirochaetaceae bacterium]|nr:AI-2E family transporter [Spirochaetaceae bacterium]
MSEHKRFGTTITFSLTVLSTIAVCAVLKITAGVVIPVVVAILLSFVFEPAILFLNERLHFPRFLANILVILIFIVALVLVAGALTVTISSIQSQYVKYENRFLMVYQNIAEWFKLPFNAEATLLTNLWEQGAVRTFVANTIVKFSNELVSLVKNFVLVILFMFFFFGEMGVFRKKIQLIFSANMKDSDTIRNMIIEAISKVTKYLSIKFIISFFTGLFVFLLTSIVKLDFAFLWGVIAFVLNFIPNFGSIVSGVLTTAFALVQFWGDASKIIYVGIVMLSVNMILGNLVEPKLQGDQLGISPFAILVSLSIWGFLWDFAGLILAVPIMAIIKIVADNIGLKTVSVLLQNKSALENSPE